MDLIRGELVGQLQAYRLKAGLTQGDIAWKLGFSLPTVSRWERGICRPDLRAVGATYTKQAFAVPEPLSISLVCLGLMGVAVARRRRM